MEVLKPIISIMGPTNTGKTSLAIQLAQVLDAEIISVDSVQLYKYANIGSNKPTFKTLKKYPHHLIDLLQPTDNYSVGSFRRDAIEIIQSIDERKKNTILVGGTMMYFDSIFKGISEMPETNLKIRKKLDEEHLKFGIKYLHKKLEKVDKESAEKIHENDQQRIKRSLEVYLITGKTHTEFKKIIPFNPLGERRFLNFSIIPEDKIKFKKDLQIRFLNMLKQGLIKETKTLMSSYSKNVKLLSSVGYKQVIEFLEDKISEEQMIEKATNANYQLSKRQLTWLKKFKINETFFSNQSNMVIKILNYLE